MGVVKGGTTVIQDRGMVTMDTEGGPGKGTTGGTNVGAKGDNRVMTVIVTIIVTIGETIGIITTGFPGMNDRK